MDKLIIGIGILALVIALFLGFVVYPLYQERTTPARPLPSTPQNVAIPPDDRLQRLPPADNPPAAAPAQPAPVITVTPRPSEPLKRLQLIEEQITQLQALNNRMSELENRLNQLAATGNSVSPDEINDLRQQLSALGTAATSARPASSTSTASTVTSAAVTAQATALSGRITTMESKASALETNVSRLERMVISPQSNWNR